MIYCRLDWEADKPALAKRIGQRLEKKLQWWREKKEAELLALYRSVTSV
jgi:hypothetical protein